jgi:hypothetical protein
MPSLLFHDQGRDYMNVLIAIGGTMVALALASFACYKGDGAYRHRQRLDFMPKLWGFVMWTGAFAVASLANASAPVLYAVSVVGFVVGWGIGWILLDSIWMQAVYPSSKRS